MPPVIMDNAIRPKYQNAGNPRTADEAFSAHVPVIKAVIMVTPTNAVNPDRMSNSFGPSGVATGIIKNTT